ncbi:MAG TPA: glycosyltransferase [Candidatus Krumholzibacteria bacterium]|nr:glycosyltransferase [Candidatus Krumholzibacteria bacterium]
MPERPAPLPSGAKVALVHDWLTGMRGGEKCLEVMAEIFPEADLYTLLHVPGSVSPVIEDRRIVTSFVQRIPDAAERYRWALPLFPRAIESFDLSAYDLVLSSSHCVAKSARKRPGALSVCYCYTPMRYVWDRFDDYFGGKPQPLRGLIGWQAARLRAWDRRTAARVDRWLPISTIVRQRLLEWYGAPAASMRIVFPPVDVARFAGAGRLAPPDGFASGSYDFVLSALVPYKRIDLAVQAAVKAGRTLVVAGGGPEAARLGEMARSAPGTGRVHVLGRVDDADLPRWYGHCRSFVFPGLEDFGITPLEATAAGRPVVAYRAGGVLDTVVEGLNGVFVAEQSVDAFAAALDDARLDGPWDEPRMVAHAASFGRDRFRRELEQALADAWSAHLGGADPRRAGESAW